MGEHYEWYLLVQKELPYHDDLYDLLPCKLGATQSKKGSDSVLSTVRSSTMSPVKRVARFNFASYYESLGGPRGENIERLEGLLRRFRKWMHNMASMDVAVECSCKNSHSLNNMWFGLSRPLIQKLSKALSGFDKQAKVFDRPYVLDPRAKKLIGEAANQPAFKRSFPYSLESLLSSSWMSESSV